MKKITYLELFKSCQGEGRFIGTPSIFLRTFGCNFKCPNFGIPRGTKKEDSKLLKVEDVNPDLYDKVGDLPLVEIGCDSYAAWHKDYKKFNKKETPEELADTLTSACPNEKWVMDNGTDIHLIMTGGEPLLGWQKIYPQLFDILIGRGLKNVTFETNGTQFLKPDFVEYLEQCGLHITFSASPKLSISGQAWKDAIRPLVLKQYGEVKNSHLYLKFVVGDMVDFDEMERAVESYRNENVNFERFYAMPVGGTEEGLLLTDKRVAEICLERGITYTPRMHVNLFGNGWGK